MTVIGDASSLIVLARLNGLWLLERVLGRVGLVSAVEVETVRQGKARGYADALRIEAAISAGALEVILPTEAEQQRAAALEQHVPALSRADCLTLVCARERDMRLLSEDRRARNEAVAQGIRHISLSVLPLQGWLERRLSVIECNAWLSRIGLAMHVDPAVLEVLQAAALEIARLREDLEGESA